MPSIPLFPPTAASRRDTPRGQNDSLFPQLLQTPSGLAILELQGTINTPPLIEEELSGESNQAPGGSRTLFETEIGKLIFPDYSPINPNDTKWTKRVYLYVGRYQRMTGEVKKLAKPLAVIRRRQPPSGIANENSPEGNEGVGHDEDELEIVEIIKYKILFASRPEPVSLE